MKMNPELIKSMEIKWSHLWIDKKFGLLLGIRVNRRQNEEIRVMI